MGYYESLPRGYNNDTNKLWPAIIFLHGIGERGNGTTELSRVLGNGIPKEINNGAQLEYTVNGQTQSFVVLTPQLQSNNGDWHPYHVDRMVELAKSNYRVDPKKIYVTGLSLGGFGTMRYVEFSDAYAKKIAAVVPSDGGNDAAQIYTPDAAGGYMAPLDRCHVARNNMPVWGIYGLNDTQWGGSLTRDIAAINACLPPPNPLAIMNGLAGVGHSAWNTTYKTDNSSFSPNIYQWLLTKSKP